MRGHYDHAMRVVAGSAGGLRLQGPPSEETRPTTDKVREAIFNSLNSAMAIDEAKVLDLFAGTGACGIEALSRGAVSATFVEQDRKVITVLEANLRSTGLTDKATVVRGSVAAYLDGGSSFDLVFADPPYKFDQWPALLDKVKASVLVCESNRSLPEHDQWDVIRERSYGTTVVTFLEPATPTSAKDQ